MSNALAPSQISTDVTATLLAIFAGQTVHQDTVFAEIEAQYAYAKKRTGFASFFKVSDALKRAGTTTRYTGADYTGDCLYTFPA